VGFSQGFTNRYTPECIGATERFNKTIAEMLSHYIPETPLTEWDKHIPSVVFAYNSSLHKTLQEVPHYLMFGRNPRLPLDSIFSLPSASLSADTIMSRLKLAFEHANVQLLATHEQEKQRFDAGINAESLRTGDLVMYEVPTRKKGEPDKLQKKRKGPYLILSKLSDQSYMIQPVDRKTLPEKGSVRRLVRLDSHQTAPLTSVPPPLHLTSDLTSGHVSSHLHEPTPDIVTEEDPNYRFPTRPVAPRRSARIREKRLLPTPDPDFGCNGDFQALDSSGGRISLVRVGWCCPDCFFG
jgi:hypothetical protein